MKTQSGVIARGTILGLMGLLGWLALQHFSAVFALDSGAYYLRLLGGDMLSMTSPTATTARFKDSPPVNRTTYQEIGVWAASGATGAALRCPSPLLLTCILSSSERNSDSRTL